MGYIFRAIFENLLDRLPQVFHVVEPLVRSFFCFDAFIAAGFAKNFAALAAMVDWLVSDNVLLLACRTRHIIVLPFSSLA